MYLDKRRTSTISTILYINERNRKLNVKEAENAIRAEREALGGVRQSDPFTRRQTRPTMVTKDVKTNDLTAEQIKELEDEKKMKAEKENRKKEEEARKKKMTEEKSREEERKKVAGRGSLCDSWLRPQHWLRALDAPRRDPHGPH